jgi:hypothetical protein
MRLDEKYRIETAGLASQAHPAEPALASVPGEPIKAA